MTYCHLCDADPCFCGRNGVPEHIPPAATRGPAAEADDAIRSFVLSSHEAGARHHWLQWMELIEKKFPALGHKLAWATWSQVSNDLQREMVLIEDPNGDGPMETPDQYPNARRLSLEEATAEIERLIRDGLWTTADKGLKLWQVWKRVGDAISVDIQDALHDLNRRGYLVTTKSVYWYVRP